MHVYAPAPFEQMLKMQLDMFCPNLEFEVVFHPVDTTQYRVIYEDRSMTVTSIPLNHRVPCCGFLFKEKPTLPHIRRDMIDYYGIPYSQINNIKNGADWTTENGDIISNDKLVTQSDPPRSYAYCSDTAYIPSLYEAIKGVNLLYHESTYSTEHENNAKKYAHSTAHEAAVVAHDAGAKQLMIGHYSAKYTNEDVLLEEAKRVFPNTILSAEGLVVDVK